LLASPTTLSHSRTCLVVTPSVRAPPVFPSAAPLVHSPHTLPPPERKGRCRGVVCEGATSGVSPPARFHHRVSYLLSYPRVQFAVAGRSTRDGGDSRGWVLVPVTVCANAAASSVAFSTVCLFWCLASSVAPSDCLKLASTFIQTVPLLQESGEQGQPPSRHLSSSSRACARDIYRRGWRWREATTQGAARRRYFGAPYYKVW